MNQIFNLKRFLSLIRIFFIESGFRILLYFVLSSIVLTGLLSVLFAVLDIYSFTPARYFFLFMFLIVNQSIVMSVTGHDFRDKKTLSQYLLLPNSVFEKVLSFLLVSQLFYISISVAIYKIVDYMIVDEVIPRVKINADRFILNASPMLYDTSILEMIILVLMFFSLLSFTFFVTNKLIKSLLGIGFFGFLFVLSVGLNNVLFYDVELKAGSFVPFGPVFVKNPLKEGNSYLLHSNLSDLFLFSSVVLPLLLIGIAVYYFKLKEQEV